MGVICGNKLVVQSAIESSYGVDPGSGYVPILINTDSSISPAADEVTRDVMKPHSSPSASVMVRKRFNITMNVELKGGGISGTLVAPEVDTLLRACYLQKPTGNQYVTVASSTGFLVGETVTITGGAAGAAGTIYEVQGNVLYLYGGDEAIDNADVLTGVTSAATSTASAAAKDAIVYRPTSGCEAGESITLRFSYAGVRFIATGVRGNVSMNMASGGYPTLSFTFQGIYAIPTDQTIPSADFSDIVPPRANGVTFIIGTNSTLDPVDISFDLGNTITPRDSLQSTDGIKSFVLDGMRNGRGSVNPEMLTLAEFDPFTPWAASTTAKIAAQVGTASGNTLRMTWPYAQYISLPLSKRTGVMAYDLGFLATGSDAGDDEFFLSVLEV